MKNYIILAIVIVAAILLAKFVDAFVDWNKEQACATSGGRNCGGPRVMLTR